MVELWDSSRRRRPSESKDLPTPLSKFRSESAILSYIVPSSISVFYEIHVNAGRLHVLYGALRASAGLKIKHLFRPFVMASHGEFNLSVKTAGSASWAEI